MPAGTGAVGLVPSGDPVGAEGGKKIYCKREYKYYNKYSESVRTNMAGKNTCERC